MVEQNYRGGRGAGPGMHDIQQQIIQQQRWQESQIQEVIVTTDVFRSCLYHAYLTSQEEVAGLLLGNKSNDQGSIKIYCLASVTNQRKTKEKDRVEIDPESLSEAMFEAELLSKEAGVPIDVIGWYHSHPNITVFPSQVDINTQFRLQMVGADFIGLIFSVFVTNNSSNQGNQVVAVGSANPNISKTDLIAFQSYEDYADGLKKARTLRVRIVDSQKLDFLSQPFSKHDFFYNVQNIQKVLIKEQEQDYQQAQKATKDQSLQKVTNASLNILSYCKILENVSNPTDIVLQSYQSNLTENISLTARENAVIQQNIDQLQLEIIKAKQARGLGPVVGTPGGLTPGPTPY